MHQLNGWPLHARAHDGGSRNKWASSAIAGGGEEEEAHAMHWVGLDNVVSEWVDSCPKKNPTKKPYSIAGE